MEEEQHYLEAFLAEALPKLGLDQETYGPYVTGADEEDDDLDDIIELLRASSESHSDDDESWAAFKLQIVKRRREYMLKEKEKKETMALDALNLQKESLQREIEIAQSNALEVEQRLEAKKAEGISAEKLALMDQYGYEVEGEENVDGDDNGGASNRDHAAKQHVLENAKKTRSQYQQTKKDARAETKQAKADKNAKKEERRKRATKGERKR